MAYELVQQLSVIKRLGIGAQQMSTLFTTTKFMLQWMWVYLFWSFQLISLSIIFLVGLKMDE